MLNMRRFGAVLGIIVSICGAPVVCAAQTSSPEIIAHRGASYDAPENSLAAFRLGYAQKADAVELDIHLTKDGRIIVLHDPNTKRITGVDKPVVEQTFAELRTQDAGKWKGAQFAGEKLPSLDEVIALVPADKKLVIEIKCGPEAIPALKETLAKSGRPDRQFLIIGFSQPTMKAVKKALPGIEMYWLSSFRKDAQTGAVVPSVDDLIRLAKDAGVEGVNLSYGGPIDAEFVRKIKGAGLKCYVWTVDDPAVARRLVEAGVDGITTNRPAWLREQIQSRP